MKKYSSPYRENLVDFFLAVRCCRDDKQTVQQVDGDSVRTLVRSASDSTRYGNVRMYRYMLVTPLEMYILGGGIYVVYICMYVYTYVQYVSVMLDISGLTGG